MPNAYEMDNSYKLSRKNDSKTNKNLKSHELDLDKVILTLDTITNILRNKSNIEMLLSEFSANPAQLAGVLTKVSSLKRVMDTSSLDLSSILDSLQDKN